MLFRRQIKNPIQIADKGVTEWKYTTCGYCSTGCSIEIGLNEEGVAVTSRGVGGAPVNQGNPPVDPVPFGHWTLRDEAAQRRSPAR